jgi:hypothetical protein
MLKISWRSQRLYCHYGRPGDIPPCRVTFLSYVPSPREGDMETSVLHLSVSQKLFCPKMLQLFDGGVIHRPRVRITDPPLTRRRGGQYLLVLVPSAHSDPGYAVMVKNHLEMFLDNSIPEHEPRSELTYVRVEQQAPIPIDPDYLYAWTADMNDLLVHSVGLGHLQNLPTSEWVCLHINVADDALINVIFAAVRA